MQSEMLTANQTVLLILNESLMIFTVHFLTDWGTRSLLVHLRHLYIIHPKAGDFYQYEEEHNYTN